MTKVKNLGTESGMDNADDVDDEIDNFELLPFCIDC